MSGYYDTLSYAADNPIVASKLKLKRARHHLLEVESGAKQLPLKQPYQFIVPAQPKAGKHHIIWMHSHPMPSEFSAAVGDAIHNLRSAFDFMAIFLTVPPIGTGSPNKVYFPTGKDQQSFIKAMEKKMHGAQKKRSSSQKDWSPTLAGSTASANFMTSTSLINTN